MKREQLHERLNQILPRLVSDELLSGKGMGNEIGFYIFDYPPADECHIREHVTFLLEQLPKKRPGLRVCHVNLFEMIVQHLKDRNLWDKALKMQVEKGDGDLLDKLKKPLDPGKLAKVFITMASPAEHDLVLVSGAGSSWPLLRTSGLLNCLHPHMGDTPLVLFYPGEYDQRSLTPFGRIPSNNYYRAFRLVS